MCRTAEKLHRGQSEAGSSVEDPLMENQGERGPAPPYTEATSNSTDSGIAFGDGPMLANSASSPSMYMSRPELVSVDTSNSSRSAFGQTRRPGLFRRSETARLASGLSHLLWRLHPGQRRNTNGHENASANDLTDVRSSPFDSLRPSKEQQGTRGRPRSWTICMGVGGTGLTMRASALQLHSSRCVIYQQLRNRSRGSLVCVSVRMQPLKMLERGQCAEQERDEEPKDAGFVFNLFREHLQPR
ncbi:uncharacterized protein LAESUDRAFT_461208 [Laetiporus sulphureus 93-53]|uniref:Uncharacterized protein n=1 Tax=Laetiporus sulphureus 93-53 TaxID=1314785 RepID=A0A165G4D9_9APHY|nr:uncharacterized protein LAESUDRAFT_461208 [Laetiporus sulphureus 93-53]KZT09814.1 hypothetical protein LAESUDRAFT_461208 [Laetiporus sulphureus 93-53]